MSNSLNNIKIEVEKAKVVFNKSKLEEKRLYDEHRVLVQLADEIAKDIFYFKIRDKEDEIHQEHTTALEKAISKEKEYKKAKEVLELDRKALINCENILWMQERIIEDEKKSS